jgi:hypothetical protein
MANGDPPITPAPVPPSVAGEPSPKYASGSATVPAPGPITGTPVIPPPTIGNPVGVPVFPPTGSNTAPVAVPRGPLVGPAVPSGGGLPGVTQPQYGLGGSATVPPASALFPAGSTTPPQPPVEFANIAMIGNTPPPSTPGQTPPPVVPSAGATIPQLPWTPPLTNPPSNVTPPAISGTPNVGSALTVVNNGIWNNLTSINPTHAWRRGATPIAGATAVSYTLVAADVGAMISCIVTMTNSVGSGSAQSNALGPVTDTGGEDPEDAEPAATTPHRAAHRAAPTKSKKRR